MSSNYSISNPKQRGAAALVGIVLIVILVLAAAVFGYFALTSKSSPQLQVETPKVTANDLLTQGTSNNELSTDYLIVEAGVKRDNEQAKATSDVLADEPQAVGDGVTTDTTVESARLSQLQTEFISEVDRRIKNLTTASDASKNLNSDQKTATQKTISDEITALTGLKAKSAAETTKDAFLADRTELDKEYVDYLMAATQVRLLLWANDQTMLDEKVNVLGGKLQERLNAASNNGESIAVAQTRLNSYQSDKTSAKAATAAGLKSANEVKPNTFNANKAVLQQYADQLSSAHTSIDKALASAKTIIVEIQSYKK